MSTQPPSESPDVVSFPKPGPRPDGARPRVLALPAQVHQERAEKFAEICAETVHVVTARALAPLKTLCDQAFPLIAKGAVGLFPKGQDVAAELTEAAKYWRLEASLVPSVTNPASAIVVVRALKRLGKKR